MKIKKYAVIFLSLISFYAILNLLVFFEHEQNEALETIWDAIWYFIITISTVGYGDAYPVTLGGKIIGTIIVLLSAGFLSVIIGKISYSLSEIGKKKKMGYYGTKFEDHVVIIGWNNFTKMIAEELLEANQRIAIVIDEKSHIDSIYQKYKSFEKNLFLLCAEYDDYETFEKVNISKAKIVHLGLESDSAELVAIINLKNIYGDLKFVVILEDKSLSQTFKAAGVTYVLSKNELSSKLLASYIFEPEVADFTVDLLSKAVDDDDFDIQQFRVIESNPMIGKSLSDLVNLATSEGVKTSVIALKRKDRDIDKLPLLTSEIKLGDIILFINNYSAQEFITNLFRIEQGI